MQWRRDGGGPARGVGGAVGRTAAGAIPRALAAVLGALAALLSGCAAEPGHDNLQASFWAQIESIESVGGAERIGDDALTFTQTRADGTEVRWRVEVTALAIENPAVEGAPLQGHVVSSWYADGEPVEPLGSMSRLPDAFLAAGIAQECWALWDEDAGRWGW